MQLSKLSKAIILHIPPCMVCLDIYSVTVFLLQSLSMKWNLIRLGGPTQGIVTKTVHKTLPVSGKGQQGK